MKQMIRNVLVGVISLGSLPICGVVGIGEMQQTFRDKAKQGMAAVQKQIAAYRKSKATDEQIAKVLDSVMQLPVIKKNAVALKALKDVVAADSKIKAAIPLSVSALRSDINKINEELTKKNEKIDSLKDRVKELKIKKTGNKKDLNDRIQKLEQEKKDAQDKFDNDVKVAKDDATKLKEAHDKLELKLNEMETETEHLKNLISVYESTGSEQDKETEIKKLKKQEEEAKKKLEEEAKKKQQEEAKKVGPYQINTVDDLLKYASNIKSTNDFTVDQNLELTAQNVTDAMEKVKANVQNTGTLLIIKNALTAHVL